MPEGTTMDACSLHAGMQACDGMQLASLKLHATACIHKWGQLHWITLSHWRRRRRNADRLRPACSLHTTVCSLHTVACSCIQVACIPIGARHYAATHCLGAQNENILEGKTMRRRAQESESIVESGMERGVSPPYPTRASGDRRKLPQTAPKPSGGSAPEPLHQIQIWCILMVSRGGWWQNFSRLCSISFTVAIAFTCIYISMQATMFS